MDIVTTYNGHIGCDYDYVWIGDGNFECEW